MKSIMIRICKSLLAFLGVAVVSCDILEVKDEYGTPVMDYTVMGRVVNAQDEPLQGIKVKRLRNYPPDSTYTNENGAFSVQKEDELVYGRNQKYFVPVIVEDPEGNYARDTVEVEVKKIASSSSGGHWHWGIYENKDAKITMKKK